MTTGRSRANAGSRKGHLSPSQAAWSPAGSLNKRDDEELRYKPIKSTEQVPYVLWEAWVLISTAGITESKMTLIC